MFVYGRQTMFITHTLCIHIYTLLYVLFFVCFVLFCILIHLCVLVGFFMYKRVERCVYVFVCVCECFAFPCTRTCNFIYV